MQLMMFRAKPKSLFQKKKGQPIRNFLLTLVLCTPFEYFIQVMIILNTVNLAVTWYQEP